MALANSINTPLASQVDQEAGTSTTTYVSPGRQQYHLSACKAFCFVNNAGTPGLVGQSYNVASVTDNGVGDTTVNLTVAVITSYSEVATVIQTSSTYSLISSTGSGRITTATGTIATPVQADTGFSYHIFGDQA